MKELQYTPIRNGKMMDESEIRREKAQAKAKRIRRKRAMACVKASVVGVMSLAVVGTGILCGWKLGERNDAMEVKAMETEVTTETTEIQEYIASYGITHCYGAVIETEDGHIWTLTDAPEFEEGTEVRVLFNSCGTESVEDDIIIDVTER